MDMKTGRCAHADIGIETIAKESAGLEKLEEALADGLRETFDAVVEVILRAKGRVIVSGIGKSGHIGRKIAATLASTGTPAQFVHAAEAAHGDLGMITRADVILLLSHSGKTVELQAVMAHAQRFRIPLVAITSNAESPLAQAADHVLLLPKAEEACPLKLAPTTSTTMQLALGDALAMALLAARGFTEEDFGRFHPGGNLGAMLEPVARLMHGDAELPLAHPDDPMPRVLLEMTGKRFGAAGIVDEAGRLVGIITDGDLRRAMERHPNLMDLTAAQVMTRSPKTVSPETLAGVALGLLNEKKITVVFVVDDAGRPVGILHMHDLVRQEKRQERTD